MEKLITARSVNYLRQKMGSRKLVIFGVGKTAAYCKEIALELGMRVDCHVVESDFLMDARKSGDEVISYEQFVTNYNQGSVDVIVGLGYHQLNKTRERISKKIIDVGFDLATLISPKANVSKDSTVGTGCVIGPFVDLQHGSEIGDGSFIWSGSVVGHGSGVGQYCWIASNVTIGGDSAIGDRSFLGLGSTVSNDLLVGKDVFAGAQSLVAENVDDRSAILPSRTEHLKNMSEKILAIWGNLN